MNYIDSENYNLLTVENYCTLIIKRFRFKISKYECIAAEDKKILYIQRPYGLLHKNTRGVFQDQV